MGLRKKTALLLILILGVLLTLYCTVPSRVYAKASDEDRIRVGYYENEVFQEGASQNAVKTGYAYEYYRKLSEYTGWNYEYVYGGFSELYDKLLNGDIDLLAGLAKTDDRLGIIGYPESPMGNEIYTLVKHDEDMSVSSDPQSLSGRSIGVLESAISEALDNYLSEHSVNADVVRFDDVEMLFRAFDDKSVDIMAAEGDGAYGRDHAEVLSVFGASDYFLCVSIKRPDLLHELDQAQSRLSMEEPNYLSSLRSKYYSSSVSSRTFSQGEKEWIGSHDILRVGYLENYLPYCATDKDGNVTGIVKEMLPKMLDTLDLDGIDLIFTGYKSYDDMIADVVSEKIDVAFPVGGGLYYSEESGIYQSTSVVSASTDLVYKGEYDDGDVTHFAVNENNKMQYYYVRTNFPQAEVTLYPSIDDCLEAVLSEKAGATTLNGLRANDIIKNSKYRGLYLKQLAKSDDRCFGVKIGNEGLLKLLNRGISTLGADYAQGKANEYTGDLYTYTFFDLIRDNAWLFMSLLLFFAMLVIFFTARDLKRTRNADRLKSDFVSHMSHEIRTPITAIIGMNDMIQQETDDSRILGYSENIAKAGENLLGIINDILDFSKIESGHMELISAPYSLADLFKEQRSLIELRARDKGLSFSMGIDKTLPSGLVGDKQKLGQVMTNLLTNAVKYTEKGSVKFKAKAVSISDEELRMEISVSDTGIGIREEEMEKLFSAFDRLDLSKTGTIEGSGLGLAISQRLLGLMGSEIKAESVYGQGSVFSFVIAQKISDPEPIGDFDQYDIERRELSTSRKKATFRAPKAKILVVDDTQMNLQVICGLLKNNDLTIDTAESGDKCIEMFAENSYDCVFLDQRMPGKDGVETLGELKKLYPDKMGSVPVISLTANVLSDTKANMLKAGFTDYLAKPVKLSDLEAVLLKYLPEDKIEQIKEEQIEEEPADDDTEIPEKIRMVKSIDIQKGIEYCGDAEDYIDAIKTYSASAGEKAGRLRAFLSESDLDNFAILVHSVKSTSGAIGATELQKKAAQLEKAAREKDAGALKADAEDFIQEYADLGKTLSDALG